jgi:hypothetical protein
MAAYLTKNEQELARAAIERWEDEGGRALPREEGFSGWAGGLPDSDRSERFSEGRVPRESGLRPSWQGQGRQGRAQVFHGRL